MLRKAYYVNMFTISAVKLSFTTETKSLPQCEIDSTFCYHFFVTKFSKRGNKICADLIKYISLQRRFNY